MKSSMSLLACGSLVLCSNLFTLNKAEAAQLCKTTNYVQAYDSESICVSSAREPKGDEVYDILSLMDGDDASAWCADGVGESIIVRLKNAAPPENFQIRNGYGKTNATFQRNARIRTMELSAFSYNQRQPARKADITLDDRAGKQTVPVPWVVEDPRYFELRITSVYPGKVTKHACMSGFSVDYGM